MAKKQSVVTMVAETRQYDKGIDDAAKKLRDFGKNGLSSLEPLFGAWGKLVPAVAAAAGGVKTFNKIIDSTQTLTDSYATIQRQLNSSIDTFFNSIARGDFSNFINNLKSVTKYAKDAYLALDDLGTFNIFKGGELADIDAERARLTAEIKSGNRAVRTQNADGTWSAEIVKMTKAEVEAARKQLEEYDRQRLNIVASGVEKETRAYNDLLKQYIGEGGFKGSEQELQSAIDYYLRGYTNYSEASRKLEELNKKIADNQIKTMGAAGTSSSGAVQSVVKTIDNETAKAIKNSEEYKNLTAIVELGDQKLEEAMQHRVAAAALNQEMNRALQKDAKTAAAGGKSSLATAVSEDIVQRDLDLPFERMKNAILGANEALAQMADQLDEIDDIELIPEADVEKWTKQQEALKNNTIKLKTSWDNLQDSMQQKAIGEIADAFSTLGSAIGGTEGAVLSFVGSMVQQATQSIATIASLKAQEEEHKANMTAALGDAAAQTMSAHSWIPFVGVAMGVGMVATLVSTLMSLPKFANGGIVGGNDHNDGILARVSSGEMILNQSQQANLMQLLNGEGGTSEGRVVEFKIRDSELVGILNQFNAKSSRRI